jgi:XdhC and CoxI family
MMRGESGDTILEAMVDLRAAKQPFVLATVIETDGSVSAKPGSKAVIGQNGRVVTGWVGGGCAENSVCHTALDCLRTGDTAGIELDMNDEVLGTGIAVRWQHARVTSSHSCLRRHYGSLATAGLPNAFAALAR